MSRAVRNGLIVAVLHVAIVAGLGAKLIADRMTRPRVWARVAPIDPDLPIRGRYVRLQLEVQPADGLTLTGDSSDVPIDLSVRHDALVAIPATETTSGLSVRSILRQGEQVVALTEPVAYFIPEHVPDPSRRPPGEELWAEVTLPRRGTPRPIRLGIKKDGTLTPLDLR
jgi:hypothetical protein